MKRISFFILSLLACIGMWGQQIQGNKDIIPPSPTSWAFVKWNPQTPSLLTGAVSLSVPLYTLECRGLSIPFSLEYHSNGIKMYDDPAPCGYGWFLSPGLRISRTIMGRPDEQYAWRTAINSTDYDEFDFHWKGLLYDNAAIPGSTLIDTQRDVFTLSLPGKQATFLLEKSGDSWVAVNYGNNLKIAVSYVSSTYTLSFVVTDDDGTQYYFDTYTEYLTVPRYVTSWMLRKIVLPTGEEISFTWSSWAHHGPSTGTQYGASVLRDMKAMYNTSDDWEYIDAYEDGLLERYGKHEKVQHLTGVTFPGGTISVSYQTGLSPFMTSFQVQNSSGRKVVQRDFTYGSGVAEQYLLKKITQEDGGSYTFTYNSLYFNHDYAQDYWGYYNGKTSNLSLVPKMKMKVYLSESTAGSTTEMLLGNADRSIDTSAMQANLLTRVDYPTGGYTAYEYEPHRFLGKAATNTEIHSEYNYALNEGGGLRVKKMTSKADSNSNEVVYTYTYGIGGNGLANSLDEPRLETFIDVYKTYERGFNELADKIGEIRLVYLKSVSSYLDYHMHSTPIWYSEVTESMGEGKTVYRFKNHVDVNNTMREFGKIYLTHLNTLFSQGPLLVQRIDYKQSGGSYLPVRKQEYNYEVRQERSDVMGLLMRRRVVNTISANAAYGADFEYAPDKVHIYLSDSPYLQSHNGLDRSSIYENNSLGISFKRERLTRQRTVEYSGSDSLVSVEEYTYSSWLPKTVKKSDGQGNVLETETRNYPFEYTESGNSSQQSVLAQMANLNVVSVPFSITTARNGSTFCREWYFKLYGTRLFRPVEELLGKDGGTLQRVASYEYDNYGNLLGVTRGEQKEGYLWAYGNRYPVAKVTGANYSDLNSWLGSAYLTVLGNNTSTVSDVLSSIRTKLSSRSVLLSTYDYIPLVGMKQTTFPNGDYQTYHYDKAGRLLKLKDNGGNIREQHEYRYQNGVVIAEDVEASAPLPTIEFTNVEQHVRESYGNYYSTATIECEEAMTVEFSLVPMMESGTFSCTIGENYSLSGSGVENGEEKFTVELDAGTNYVEIRLIDSPTGSVDLFIQEVDGGTVGDDSTLTVMAEKAEN